VYPVVRRMTYCHVFARSIILAASAIVMHITQPLFVPVVVYTYAVGAVSSY